MSQTTLSCFLDVVTILLYHYYVFYVAVINMKLHVDWDKYYILWCTITCTGLYGL